MNTNSGTSKSVMGPARNSARQATFWLLLCFVCSGMSGLIYEVAWVRSLELIFGATTFAIATVLAAFMGGLALGSYSMGRVAHRFARFHPLAVYGAIECLIAVSALLIPAIFKSLIPFYQTVWTHLHASFIWFSIIRFLLCVAILLVPTFLMGATLPIVSTFVAGGQRGGNRRIGLLYASNTLGAVLGCVAAGLVLFPTIGLARTQWVAVVMNVVAAAGAFLLAQCHAGRTLAGAPINSVEPAEPADDENSIAAETTPCAEITGATGDASMQARRSALTLLVSLYAISGFTAMLYEVAWSRVLVLVLGSSTYAYTIMLATFLLGLSLGAYLATRFLGNTSQPLLVAGICQVMIALATYFGMFLVEELPYFYLLAFENFHLMGRGLLAVQFGLAIALMILPTLGLGAMFPITIRGLNPSTAQAARLVGWSYALNTCGAIVGSVLAGFWLVPHWGSQKTMLAGITLNALCGALAVLSVKTIGFARPRRICATLVFGFIASLFLSNYQWPAYVLSSGIFRYVENYQGLGHQPFKDKMRENRGDILYFKEGLTCTVTVCRTATAVSLLVNGKPDASVPSALANPVNPAEKPQLKYGDLPTQISLGEIPMLLAAAQDRVMVIGLGSGVTLGSVLRHPVKRVECVELEDAVVKACRFFHDYNGYPLYDKRVDLVVNDARNHLLVTDKKYDVIISEPSNPWIAGAASLFTSEFFKLASSKLQPNGIFCQWIQLYELQSEEFQAILRSFTAAFPSVHIFRVDMDAILVGSTKANPIRLDQLQARLIPDVKADLERIECRGAADLLANYWIGGQELRDFLQPGPRNTDDNMLIEFAAPLRMLSRSSKEQVAFVQQLAKVFHQHSTGLLPNVQLGNLDNQAQANFWAGQSEASLRKQRVNEAILYADQSLKLSRTPLAVQVKGEALAQAGRREEAKAWWAAAEKEFPQEPVILRALTLVQQRENHSAAARLFAERWLAAAPEDPRAKFLLGQICYQQKDWPGALLLLEPLVSVPTGDATPYELNYTLGSVYWRLGNYPRAIETLKIVVEQVPNHIDARIRLADSLLRVGREKEAFAEWQRVSYFRSGAAQALLQEAKTASEQNHGDQARAKFEQAFQFDPWNDDVNFHLARARKQSGDLTGAADVLEKYLAANPDRPWAVAYLAQICAQLKKTARAVELAERYQAITGLAWRELKD